MKEKMTMEIEDFVVYSRKLCTKLQNEDRKQRRAALTEFLSILTTKTIDSEILTNVFNETQVYLVNTLRDKYEDIRELGIKCLKHLIQTLPVNDFYLTYIFPVLVERIGTVELVEESEEIREELVKFLYQIIEKYSNCEEMKPFLNDSFTILSKTVKDKYPAIKELSCRTIVLLAHALPRDFHLQAESFIQPVLTCFNHQRFRVRVEGIKCIGTLISCLFHPHSSKK